MAEVTPIRDGRRKIPEGASETAVRMRLEGATYPEIARELGVSGPHAQNLVWRVLEPEKWEAREAKRKRRQRAKKARNPKGGPAPRLPSTPERERKREANRSYMKVRRAQRYALLEQIKGVPCPDCAGSFPACAMQFDHRPGTTKLFNIGERYASVNEHDLLLEIAKCDVVCANCHAIRTHGGRQ